LSPEVPDDDEEEEEEEDVAPDDPLDDEDDDEELLVVSGPPVQALTVAALAKRIAARVRPRLFDARESAVGVISAEQNGHDDSVVRT